MNTNDLNRILNSPNLNKEPSRVVIDIAKPSIGQTATCDVSSAYYGFDWERGLFIINPAKPLVPINKKEALYDMAFDFIWSLSEERTHKGNPTSLAKRAKTIMDYAEKLSNENGI